MMEMRVQRIGKKVFFLQVAFIFPFYTLIQADSRKLKKLKLSKQRKVQIIYNPSTQRERLLICWCVAVLTFFCVCMCVCNLEKWVHCA